MATLSLRPNALLISGVTTKSLDAYGASVIPHSGSGCAQYHSLGQGHVICHVAAQSIYQDILTRYKVTLIPRCSAISPHELPSSPVTIFTLKTFVRLASSGLHTFSIFKMCSVYIFLYDCGCCQREGDVVHCAKVGTPACPGVKELFRRRDGYKCPAHGG